MPRAKFALDTRIDTDRGTGIGLGIVPECALTGNRLIYMDEPGKERRPSEHRIVAGSNGDIPRCRIRFERGNPVG